MEGVSARTGIAKTTIYRRWKNREQLALDMCLHAMKAAT
jgi:AcrR family transcriptional regulator